MFDVQVLIIVSATHYILSTGEKFSFIGCHPEIFIVVIPGEALFCRRPGIQKIRWIPAKSMRE